MSARDTKLVLLVRIMLAFTSYYTSSVWYTTLLALAKPVS
jgi:hypothetical protein